MSATEDRLRKAGSRIEELVAQEAHLRDKYERVEKLADESRSSAHSWEDKFHSISLIREKLEKTINNMDKEKV